MSDYEILGLPPTATHEEVKKKYYQLAKETHPDKNDSPDAAAKFAEISRAYNNIINGSSNIGSNDAINLMNNFMNMFIRVQPQVKPFIQQEIIISLEELFHGTTRDINVNNTIYTLGIPKGYNINLPIITNIGGFDVILQISVSKHHTYTLDYPNLSTVIDINLNEALIGFERTIILLNNTEQVVQSDRIICPNTVRTIQGLGITPESSLTICINVHFPTNLNDTEKETIKTIDAFSSY